MWNYIYYQMHWRMLSPTVITTFVNPAFNTYYQMYWRMLSPTVITTVVNPAFNTYYQMYWRMLSPTGCVKKARYNSGG
jgi:hypothetical protein